MFFLLYLFRKLKLKQFFLVQLFYLLIFLKGKIATQNLKQEKAQELPNLATFFFPLKN